MRDEEGREMGKEGLVIKRGTALGCGEVDKVQKVGNTVIIIVEMLSGKQQLSITSSVGESQVSTRTTYKV